MSDKKKKVNLRSEELFNIIGIVALNMDPTPYVKRFGTYDKAKNLHEITLTTDDLILLIDLYKKHSNQKGLTLRILAKLEMLRDLIKNDVNWESQKNEIMTKYKVLAKKIIDEDIKEMEIS